MNISHRIFLIALTIFSIMIIFESYKMPYSSAQSFGPGYIPLNISIIFLILIVFVALSELKKKKKVEIEEDDGLKLTPFLAMGLIAISTYIMELTSILLPLFIVVIVVSKFFLRNSWSKTAFSSVSTVTFIYFIFGLWLNIPLV